MKKIILLLCLPLLLSACSMLSTALTDKDVLQYVQAYNNIAAISPELTQLKKDNNSITLLTCTPCRARLEKAVQDAGYKDITTFMVTDTRMHLTLRAYFTVLISKITGEVGQSVEAKDFCGNKEKIARTRDPKAMKYECERLFGYTSYLNKAGAMVVKVAEKLLDDGDIETVGKHIEAIHAALSNKKLAGEFNHGNGGYDD